MLMSLEPIVGALSINDKDKCAQSGNKMVKKTVLPVAELRNG